MQRIWELKAHKHKSTLRNTFVEAHIDHRSTYIKTKALAFTRGTHAHTHTQRDPNIALPQPKTVSLRLFFGGYQIGFGLGAETVPTQLFYVMLQAFWLNREANDSSHRTTQVQTSQKWR